MSCFDYIFTTFAPLARHASVPRWNFAAHGCQMTAPAPILPYPSDGPSRPFPNPSPLCRSSSPHAEPPAAGVAVAFAGPRHFFSVSAVSQYKVRHQWHLLYPPPYLGVHAHESRFFESENKENWKWWMEQLSKAIGLVDNLAVCTDACKGLEAAVAAVWPDCEKRECFSHLMDNLKKYYHGEVYGKNMWPAARAYTESKFHYFFDKVVAASPSILDWPRKDHSLLWARS